MARFNENVAFGINALEFPVTGKHNVFIYTINGKYIVEGNEYGRSEHINMKNANNAIEIYFTRNKEELDMGYEK